MPFFDSLRLSVLIPCYNEAATVRSVVRDFRAALPNASIYVFDNNSTDNTSDVARATGAVVRQVGYQGKGNVFRRMFADIYALELRMPVAEIATRYKSWPEGSVSKLNTVATVFAYSA